jgi:hypothetical protein
MFVGAPLYSPKPSTLLVEHHILTGRVGCAPMTVHRPESAWQVAGATDGASRQLWKPGGAASGSAVESSSQVATPQEGSYRR